jgi:REP element-mobilizing transposase RayT
MPRQIRIEEYGGWYHAMARGLERRRIFEEDRDAEHFLALLAEAVDRFALVLHAYVLMPNHYHLLLQTPEANLSRAMQWLNVSYSVWFNRRHQRVGPLFQGRFGAVPIDGEGAWALDASVYLHLNPVRVAGLGLDRRRRKATRHGSLPPTPELVQRRLETLRQHRYSSYRAYVGDARVPAWLTCDELRTRAQRPGMEPTNAYRWHVEEPLKAGVEAVRSLGEKLHGAVVLGAGSFVERLRSVVRRDGRSRSGERPWRRLLPIERVMEAVSLRKGEPWERFRDRKGDSGRDIVLYVAWRHCGRTHRELGSAVGNMGWMATAKAIQRVRKKLQTDEELSAFVSEIESALVEPQT